MQDWISLFFSLFLCLKYVLCHISIIYFLGGIKYYFVVGGGEKLKLAGTKAGDSRGAWQAKVHDDTYHKVGRKATSTLFHLE